MKFSASLTFMFTELPFLDRFQAARDAGFDGVEIQVLPDLPLADIARAREAADITVALINVGMGDLLEGGLGLSGVPDRRDAYAAALARAMAATEALAVAHVHVGPSRTGSARREDCLATYRDNLARSLDAAQRLACPPRLLIEPMNRVDMPDALITDIAAAAAIAQNSPENQLGLLFDIYHETMNGHDPVESYRRHSAEIAHAQFSNVPGRREPGVGELDLSGILAALVAAGYDGWFGAEYKPSATTTATLGWLAPWRAIAARS
ncbi:TIM barrel protein [Novosphingobium mathurense]|uniref:Hydroxypyruvate isomerase n=1 Tax=Novosphingobium mathurense TaxID=428990 RepID=A0A1U6IIS2_9SPHN|nr:TIM barrel protein [Novosphingobium mathurense]SLK07897.1 hydroxypyruvate isomerase [Novosphingobium mathurense]